MTTPDPPPMPELTEERLAELDRLATKRAGLLSSTDRDELVEIEWKFADAGPALLAEIERLREALAHTWDAAEAVVREQLEEIERLREALADTWEAAEAVYGHVADAGCAGVFDDAMDKHRDVIDRARTALAQGGGDRNG